MRTWAHHCLNSALAAQFLTDIETYELTSIFNWEDIDSLDYRKDGERQLSSSKFVVQASSHLDSPETRPFTCTGKIYLFFREDFYTAGRTEVSPRIPRFAIGAECVSGMPLRIQ
jgi:hypothetical protein